MIRIRKEDIFFNALDSKDSIRPDRHAIVFIYQGSLRIESSAVVSTNGPRNIAVI